jgi:CHAT domain-containing protein
MFGAQGKALIGPAATKAAVQREISGHSIIHFATHGYLAEEAPLLSSILLADGQELTVYELLGLRIDAWLVVLSACRTALGQTTAGDDVLGLSRGLLAAGAGAALVTLWPVADISTCLLMQDFYKRLQRHDPPAMALREAQNWLRGLDASRVQALLEALPGSLAEPSAPQGASASSARDTLEKDLQNEVRTAGLRSRDYRHPRHWAPFVLVSPW